MTFKFGGSGGGGGVTEMTVNASGTVAAGDPVIAAGGTAVKVAGKAAGTAKNQPSSTYHDNFGGGTYYHYHVRYGVDTAQQRVAVWSYMDQYSQGNTSICGLALNANGTYSSQGTPVGMQNLGYYHVTYDMIYDHVNTCWLIYTTDGTSATNDGVYRKWKTTNGTSGGAYYSQDYDTSETQHYQSFVKDASGRIYSTTRHGATNTFRTAKVDFSADSNNGDVLSGTIIGTNTHGGTTYGVKSVYDATNDQIIVLTGMNSTTETYKMTALDIDGSGGLSISHTATFGTSDGVDSNTTGSWTNLSPVSMKMDTNGNIAIVNGMGGFVGMHNSGSAITFGEARADFFGGSAPDQCGIFPLSSVPGMFVGTRVDDHNGTNDVKGTFFSMASGKISGSSTTKTIGSYVNVGARFNITYTHGNRDYFQDKFGIVGTSDVLWTPYNAGSRYSYTSNEDFSVSNLDIGALSGMAKSAASSGNSMVVNLAGATQTGLSGKTAGTKYFVNNTGAIVDAEPSTTPKAFLGTGLSATEILVGEDLDLVTPVSIKKFTDTAASRTSAGFQAGTIVGSFATFMNKHDSYATVSATGTNSLLSVTGAGIVKYFIASHNGTSTVVTNLAVFIDDVQIYTTGNVSTRTQNPLSVVGTFRGGENAGGGHGTYLVNDDLKFNNKFEVRNNGGTATSFVIVYKIIGV